MYIIKLQISPSLSHTRNYFDYLAAICTMQLKKKLVK